MAHGVLSQGRQMGTFKPRTLTHFGQTIMDVMGSSSKVGDTIGNLLFSHEPAAVAAMAVSIGSKLLDSHKGLGGSAHVDAGAGAGTSEHGGKEQETAPDRATARSRLVAYLTLVSAYVRMSTAVPMIDTIASPQNPFFHCSMAETEYLQAALGQDDINLGPLLEGSLGSAIASFMD